MASALLVVPGCGSGGTETVAVRDSAGVRIVEIPDPAAVAAERWRVSADPTVEIGPASGASGELYQVVSAFRMADGRIVVANAGTSELRIFDAGGRHLRSVGASGDGPGEFRRLFWAGPLRGDSIGAWDAALARLSVFDSEGRFVRAMTPQLRLGFYPQVVAALDDGSLVLTGGMDAGAPMLSEGGVRRDTVSYLVMGPDGSPTDTIGRFPGREQYLMRTPGGGFVMHPLPFGRETLFAGAGTSLVVGSTDRYELAWHRPGGGIARVLRADRDRRPVTERDVRRYREELVSLGGEGNPEVRRQKQRLLEEAPVPERMPAFTGLHVDTEGFVWIQDPPSAPADAGATWHVFDQDGGLAGAVTTPARLHVHEIGQDGLLGVFVDEHGVEHVRLHTLAR